MNPFVFWYGLISIFAFGVGCYLQDKFGMSHEYSRSQYYKVGALFGILWPVSVAMVVWKTVVGLLTRR
jgi:hypothetical protein